jgi:glycosyltransferase involved in cell wall biosynthesis
MKGVDHTLTALARVASRHPQARYRIVGKGSDKSRLQQLADSLGIGRRVIFEEDLSDTDLAERYRRCAAFVMPSGQEGFGIVFLEAMRYSKPCIGGDAGGTPDVIVDGETGYLVPFGDLNALEDRLDQLLAQPELRRRLGRAGRQRLIDEFTFDSFKARLGAYVEGLLSTD